MPLVPLSPTIAGSFYRWSVAAIYLTSGGLLVNCAIFVSSMHRWDPECYNLQRQLASTEYYLKQCAKEKTRYLERNSIFYEFS